MEINKLSRPLTLQEIEFRVGSTIKASKIWATILAYKDARTDMELLDEVVGAEKWQIKFREEKDCVVASVGILVNNEWVWKEGNGIAGDFEKEKGAYSDAQKRAGFQWGIGRCLYAFPKIFVEVKDEEYDSTKGKVNNKFRPSDWKWTLEYNNKGGVSKLIAQDKSGVRFKFEE